MHHNYTGEKLEKKAETILSKYKNGLYLEKIEPIDVDEFAEFFVGASIDFANLSDDKKTIGLTCFYDGGCGHFLGQPIRLIQENVCTP